jgi:Pectate lyase superfamily protein
MGNDIKINRRDWLRFAGLTTGAAGLASLSERSALATEISLEKSPGLFNVMDFGAKGDGVADDSDAIQKAINTAQSYSNGKVRNGGVIFLPTGTYCISKTLLITGAVKLFGQGQATIDGATHIVPSSLDFDVIKVINVNWGVVLEDFEIKNYSLTGTGGNFLRFQGCQYVRVRRIDLSNCWNGVLVDSSGDVNFYEMVINPANVPSAGRYGIKSAAASSGNPNSTQAWNCCVAQSGANVRTVDGFVLANGYNSFTTINCSALNCNRAFFSTKDGGSSPNFFVVHLGTSDHCNTAVQLEDGGYNQFSELLVTSSYVDNVYVGSNIAGPVSFSNCIIERSGSKIPPHGAGYRIASIQSANVSITGGSIYSTGGNGLDISGNSNITVSGIQISSIETGEGSYGSDGVSISESANITLSGVSISQVRNIAFHVLAQFSGNFVFSGVSQQNASRGLYDDGSMGLIVGNGSFRTNSIMGIDVSKNRNARTCIQSNDSVPWPFYPTPVMPKSGSSIQNVTGTNCMVCISGGNVSQAVIDGVNLGIQTSVYLPVGRNIAIYYSGTPTWVWQRVT